MYTVTAVTADTPELDAVRTLWKRNNKILGFFPNGAFQERARSEQILGAFDNSQLVGYVLFFTTRESVARITHLCVSEDYRGKGVARVLIDELKIRTRKLRGIGLYCRRDFDVWHIWPKLGFHAVKEKIGHSQEGFELTYFWLPHAHKSLFSELEDCDRDKVTVVLDANTFYDLLDASRNGADETHGLLADWIQPSIQLSITTELFNEIGRNPHPAERKSRRAAASKFYRLDASSFEFESAQQGLEMILGKCKRDRDQADQRQLAWAVAAKCDVFVTRDELVLSKSDDIYDKHGLIVQRPADLIARFAEVRNEREYQRRRLIGTQIEHFRQGSNAEQLSELFHITNGEEKKSELNRILNRAFAHPDVFSCKIASSDDGTPISLYLVEANDAHTYEILRFRVSTRESGTRLGNAVARTLIATIVKDAVEKGCVVVRVSDPHLSPMIQQALRQRSFISLPDCWIKLCLNEIIPASVVAQRLLDAASTVPALAGNLESFLNENSVDFLKASPERILELERFIWPGKISGTSVPSFIVPITPAWATDLFDGRLAKERLWAADSDLVLNPDSVYYRSSLPKVLEGCGRLLWYVSSGKTAGSKKIRACSQLTGTEIGDAKELFRKYRRLGVYEWRHVRDTARPRGNALMAISFTDTELFNSPIKWDDLTSILNVHGKKNYTFPSPVKIDDALFFDLYRAGSQHAPKR